MQSDAHPGAPARRAPWLGAGAREWVFRAGGLAVLRAMNRNGARILAYHRFRDSCVPLLRRQCEYLRKCHRIVALDDIDRWLYDDHAMAPNAVAVTVDDGYRDFYRVAYPIFREYQIPVTMFLTTGFLDRSCWLWCDVVAFLFARTSVTEAEIPLGQGVRRFSLRSEPERAVAASIVKEAAKRMDDDARSQLVHKQLPALLQVTVPEMPTAEYEPLNWEDVREMYRNGMRFGAHTLTHPILSSIRSETRLHNEITGPKQRIEAELGHSVFHFAYPNGLQDDLHPNAVGQLKKAGYKSAFLAESGLTRKPADPYALRRNTVEPSTPMPFFGRNILRSK